MTTTELDPNKAEAFAGRVVGLLNDAMLGLMVSVGHRAELFDRLGEMQGPGTSAEIAKHAGLQERYVREWLNAMTVGGFVEYDPAADTYRLPPEHALSLTRAAGPGNLANMAQFVSLMGGVEDDIVECFRVGGGVPYERFSKFHGIMAELSGEVHDAALFDGTLALVPGITERLEAGIDVVDIGCGQGHAINLMAERFPNSRFAGWDFSTDAIATAQAEAAERKLGNVTFDVKDVATIDGEQQFDFITAFDAIHDQATPDVVLQGISDSLRPGGVFLCVDIAGSSHVHENHEHPLAPWLYTVSTFHCMPVSLAFDGAGLGTMWGEQKANEMLRAAGFTAIDTKKIDEDPINVYYVATKD